MWRFGHSELAADRSCRSERDLSVTRHRDGAFRTAAPPDVVLGAATNKLTTVLAEVAFELA